MQSLTPSATPTQVPTVQALALELGRVTYERDLLLHQVQALEAAIAGSSAPRTGPTAWRTLKAIARFVEAGGVAALTNGGAHV